MPESPSGARYRVLLLTLGLTAIAYLDRVRISIVAPEIMKDLGLSTIQMSWVFSAFTLSYALFEIPGGWLADRFGARLTLTRVVVWWSLMSALTGFATGFRSLFLTRLFFGMGEAGMFPGISRVYARWLPSREHGRSFGLALMAALLGAAVSQPLIAYASAAVGWRIVFPLFSVLGLCWAAVWFLWFKDEPEAHPSVNREELRLIGSGRPVMHAGVPWGAILANRNMLPLCLLCASWLYGLYFWLTWLPTYLRDVHGFDLRQAGWLAALPLLMTALGLVAGGWISDLLVKKYGLRWGRSLPGITALPLGALAVLAAVQTSSAGAAALLLSLAAGLAALGITPMFAVCIHVGGSHAGVVTGTANMVGNLGGFFSPLVAGWSVQYLQSWDVPLVTVATLYLVSAVSWFFVDSNIRIPQVSAVPWRPDAAPAGAVSE